LSATVFSHGLARDLRTRLDSEVEERRRAQERLTALLLTHRQAGSVPAVQRPETPLNSRPQWLRG